MKALRRRNGSIDRRGERWRVRVRHGEVRETHYAGSRSEAEALLAQLVARPQPRARSRFVYVAVCVAPAEELVKIGRTTSPVKRLDQLRTSNPYEVRMVASREVGAAAKVLERRLLERFAAARVRGEWFRVAPDEAAEALMEEQIS